MKPAFPQTDDHTDLLTLHLDLANFAGYGGAQTFAAHLPLDQTVPAAFP